MIVAKNINKKKLKPSRVVILGAKGFVSGKVSEILKKNKIKILEIRRKDIDLTDNNSIRKIEEKIKKNDTIFFAAAQAPVKNEEMFSKNILMCKNVCFALKKKNISHFVYLSSDAVYSDSKHKIKENFETKPDNLHGMMHLTREQIFQNYIALPFLIVRPTLIFGDGDPHNGYGPNRFKKLIIDNKDINLFGKGEEKRDHIHINDVAKIIYLAIVYKTIGKLNVVSGRVRSFYEIAKKLRKMYNPNLKIIFNKRVGKMPHNGFRPLDNNMLRKLYNFKNFTDIS